MTGRKKRLARILCMMSGGGEKSWDEMTWDDVIAATKNGKYKDFEVGAMKELDLGSEGIVHMQIVGIDADDLADGSGKAPLTFISKELLRSHRFNPSITPSTAPYDEGTGGIGGWEKCEMRSYMKETIKPLIPENVRAEIKQVIKYSDIYNTSGTIVKNVSTSDDVWTPSVREVFGGTNYETSGTVYNDVFTDDESRLKIAVNTTTGNPTYWALRSISDTNVNRFSAVSNAGAQNLSWAYRNTAIPLGFCL